MVGGRYRERTLHPRRVAHDVALELPILPVGPGRLPAVAVAGEGRSETLLLPPTAPVAATKPLLFEVHDPAIELRHHGLVLLVGESIAALGFAGGLLPGPFRSEFSHSSAPSRWNGRALPASARHMPADRQPVLSCAGLPPGPSCSSPEGGGAPERRRSQLGTFAKAPACRATGTRAFRRSTAAILGPITVLLRRTGGNYRSRYPGSIGAALHPTCPSHLRRLPHRERTVTAPPGTWLRNPRLQAPPSPLRHRTSPEDALSERGWAHHMQSKEGVKFNPRVCKVHQQWLAELIAGSVVGEPVSTGPAKGHYGCCPLKCRTFVIAVRTRSPLRTFIWIMTNPFEPRFERQRGGPAQPWRKTNLVH
jgi:hypothetical protein